MFYVLTFVILVIKRLLADKNVGKSLDDLLDPVIHAIRYVWIHKIKRSNYFLFNPENKLSELYKLFNIFVELDKTFSKIDKELSDLNLTSEEFLLFELHLISLKATPYVNGEIEKEISHQLTITMAPNRDYRDVSTLILLVENMLLEIQYDLFLYVTTQPCFNKYLNDIYKRKISLSVDEINFYGRFLQD